MTDKILSTIITFIISGALGYCVKIIQTHNKKNTATNEGLKTLLQSNLTNTYFVYESVGEIPDYVYKNWLNEFEVYKSLGGNEYVHELALRMEKWKIIRTNILKKDLK